MTARPRSQHSTREVCEATNTTYRQVSHWANQGLIPGQSKVAGSGNYRTWTDEQVDAVRAIKASSLNGREVGHLRSLVAELRAEVARLRSHVAEQDGAWRDALTDILDLDQAEDT